MSIKFTNINRKIILDSHEVTKKKNSEKIYQ